MSGAAAADATGTTQRRFFMDSFARRQWSEDYTGGTSMIGVDETLLLARLEAAMETDASALKDGYAPFCKHVFLANEWRGIAPGAVAITEENASMLKSGYEARSERELPVLCRWFEGVPPGTNDTAKFLDVILYSREQIVKEKAAMAGGAKEGDDVEDDDLPPEGVPWGVISIKAQDEPYETPMQVRHQLVSCFAFFIMRGLAHD